jgi:FkbM family methyltransferase
MSTKDENRPPKLPFSLFMKSVLVGRRFDYPSRYLRWLLGSVNRRRHPELWELYLEEKQLPYVLHYLLRNDSCGVDVGCHVGSFLSLLIKCAPKGKHIAFEASKVKSEWLKRRFPSVEIIQNAVADEVGTGIFEENVKLSGYSRLRIKGETASGSADSRVVVCRLDDLLLDRKIDFIKLDIEGGELAALRGALATIKKWQPAIVFECAPEFALNKLNISRAELYDFLTVEAKYKIYCFSDFLFQKGCMDFSEFRKCGLYPFRAFNFVALPASEQINAQLSGSGAENLDYRGFR